MTPSPGTESALSQVRSPVLAFLVSGVHTIASAGSRRDAKRIAR